MGPGQIPFSRAEVKALLLELLTRKLAYGFDAVCVDGAKDTGDSNTIYYGWRTSPDETEQVFLIANMEGAPIDRCPLSISLNLAGHWDVIAT